MATELEDWIKRQVARGADRLELLSDGCAEDESVEDWPIATYKPSALAAEIERVRRGDFELCKYTAPHDYVLRSLNAKDEPIRSLRSTLRPQSPAGARIDGLASIPFERGAEAPTAEGLVGMLMNHQDAMTRLHIGGYAAAFGAMEKTLDRVTTALEKATARADILEERDRNRADLDHRERADSRRHEFRMVKAATEGEKLSNIVREASGLGKTLLSFVVGKSAGPGAGASVAFETLTDAQVDRLRTILTGAQFKALIARDFTRFLGLIQAEQIGALQEVFTAEQMTAFLAFWEEHQGAIGGDAPAESPPEVPADEPPAAAPVAAPEPAAAPVAEPPPPDPAAVIDTTAEVIS